MTGFGNGSELVMCCLSIYDRLASYWLFIEWLVEGNRIGTSGGSRSSRRQLSRCFVKVDRYRVCSTASTAGSYDLTPFRRRCCGRRSTYQTSPSVVGQRLQIADLLRKNFLSQYHASINTHYFRHSHPSLWYDCFRAAHRWMIPVAGRRLSRPRLEAKERVGISCGQRPGT